MDRLNALLEPDGELVIGERGVDLNGKMFTVKPHKDFRLFLTMDPKHGEISRYINSDFYLYLIMIFTEQLFFRAMRNRGIEIFILDNHENEYDLKSLIASKGLQDNTHIYALLKIHEFISDLVIGNLKLIY